MTGGVPIRWTPPSPAAPGQGDAGMTPGVPKYHVQVDHYPRLQGRRRVGLCRGPPHPRAYEEEEPAGFSNASGQDSGLPLPIAPDTYRTW